MRWPDGFMWGSGASSTQAEGAAQASDWWAWERAGRAPLSGDGNGFAVRYAGDFRLLAGLGLRHHRLSIEWSRVEPEPGRHDQAAVAHYRDMLAAALDVGVEPWVCLHHFTPPGGWPAAAASWPSRTGWTPGQGTSSSSPRRSATWPGAGSRSTRRTTTRSPPTWAAAGRPATTTSPSAHHPAGRPAQRPQLAGGPRAVPRRDTPRARPRPGRTAGPGRVLRPHRLLVLLDDRGPAGRPRPVPAGRAGVPARVRHLGRRARAGARPAASDAPGYAAPGGRIRRRDQRRRRARGLPRTRPAGGQRRHRPRDRLRGLFRWTAVDNYEWLHGCDLQFGIIDRDRNVRPSARVLQREAAQTRGASAV